jgi:hypothetical protein
MNSYRKLLTTIVATLVISGCSRTEEQPNDNDNLTACTEPRPQMCTMQYDPVCGVRDDGTEQTYATDCTACSDAAVTHYRSREC